MNRVDLVDQSERRCGNGGFLGASGSRGYGADRRGMGRAGGGSFLREFREVFRDPLARMTVPQLWNATTSTIRGI